MGRWNEQIFGGDYDLDEASYISEDAGIELFYFGDAGHESGGRGLEATRQHLNNNVLQRLFTKYVAETIPGNQLDLRSNSDKKLRLIFLGALAMRVGATISPNNMTLLRITLPQIRVSPKYTWVLADSHLRAPAKAQLVVALADYKNNGTPWDFFVNRCGRKGCSKTQEELAGDHKLLFCGKCKDTKYCCQECQAEDWVAHKKGCKTPEKREADEPVCPWPGLLNV